MYKVSVKDDQSQFRGRENPILMTCITQLLQIIDFKSIGEKNPKQYTVGSKANEMNSHFQHPTP